MLKNYFTQHIQRRLMRHINNARIFILALRVARQAPQSRIGFRPVVFFKASSGIDDLSWNSAFHLLTSWGLRLQGVPVLYFACDHGMSRCILGTDRETPSKQPPCRSCVYQSKSLYTGAQVNWFRFDRDEKLAAGVENLTLAELMVFNYQGIPLGPLVLPGLRWILRRHNLNDDGITRFFLREYILSAYNIALKFRSFLDTTNPQTIVVFNGQFYPEATVKWVAQQRNLRVISHEVGLQPMTGFFTDGESTAYPISIPESFDLDDTQNARLDTYLQNRFQGNFSMAGVKFWPSMKGLDETFLEKAAQYKQLVPVFTNVIFDTSQPHANTIFSDMFIWLDQILGKAQDHPETLFVIRAHPDETRARKASLETVAGWVTSRNATRFSNVIFIPPHEHISSYELILRSKFVMIYNSTIGLEASIMGSAVLCAGKARFTQYPTVFYPGTGSTTELRQADYAILLERFLAADKIDVPVEFRRNARRFLYYQLFRTSLPFGDFLDTGIRNTTAQIKWFDPRELLSSQAIQTVTKGLLENGDFLLDEVH